MPLYNIVRAFTNNNFRTGVGTKVVISTALRCCEASFLLSIGGNLFLHGQAGGGKRAPFDLVRK